MEFTDPVDGTRWTVDAEFLGSNWSCIWGAGCVGILDEPAADLHQGCCSLGAELLDEDEARTIGALAAMLDPARFQHAPEAANGGIFLDESQRHTRRIDGACIFFNRPGFAGGVGCALHLEAEALGESPLDHKPSICWQLPLKVERPAPGEAVLRGWKRSDWGPGGADMAWCCTERNQADTTAFVGDQIVAKSLHDEIAALVGPDVAVAIRERLQP